MAEILPGPCIACPYRKDVASGVWAAEEYDKLIEFDAPTAEQPLAVFACHAAPENLCHGWAVCHSNRGNEYQLLSLRMRGRGLKIPEAAVPLFASGTEAAVHGKKAIKRPGKKAKVTMDKLLKKHKRLRCKGK